MDHDASSRTPVDTSETVNGLQIGVVLVGISITLPLMDYPGWTTPDVQRRRTGSGIGLGSAVAALIGGLGPQPDLHSSCDRGRLDAALELHDHRAYVRQRGRRVSRCEPRRQRAGQCFLITVVDSESSLPINAERLRYVQRVTVFGTGCPPRYRTSRANEVVEPQAFGFDFVPKRAPLARSSSRRVPPARLLFCLAIGNKFVLSGAFETTS